MSHRRTDGYEAALAGLTGPRILRASVVLTLVLVAGALTGGCSEISAQLHDETVVASSTSEVETAGTILVTQEWGVVDGMLSVVVRNSTDRTLRSAQAVISARDENNVLVATSLEAPEGACCAVVDLPPGQQFGFWVDVGDSAIEITRVDIAYREVAWAPADEAVTEPLSVRPAGLESSTLGAVVVADVRSSVPMVTEASVQALLDGPDGAFLAVVAGRWFCFAEGRHEIRMQLLHPVPAGTTVDRVLIHPVTHDPSETAIGCAGPAAGRR